MSYQERNWKVYELEISKVSELVVPLEQLPLHTLVISNSPWVKKNTCPTPEKDRIYLDVEMTAADIPDNYGCGGGYKKPDGKLIIVVYYSPTDPDYGKSAEHMKTFTIMEEI